MFLHCVPDAFRPLGSKIEEIDHCFERADWQRRSVHDYVVLHSQRFVCAQAANFARLPEAERRVLINRAIVGSLRYLARRYGRPEPIISEVTVRSLPGGGSVMVKGSEKPLREEWGGDGRTLEGALREAKALKDPVYIASVSQAIAVEKLKRKWAKMGVVFEEVSREEWEAEQRQSAQKPRRKAAGQ